jgi:hypothetical protein
MAQARTERIVLAQHPTTGVPLVVVDLGPDGPTMRVNDYDGRPRLLLEVGGRDDLTHAQYEAGRRCGTTLTLMDGDGRLLVDAGGFDGRGLVAVTRSSEEWGSDQTLLVPPEVEPLAIPV